MGRTDEALPLHQRTLAISEKALGPEHPGTAFPLNNLAGLYQAMGRHDQALPLQQRALAILARHGQSPVELAMSQGNLAELYARLDQPPVAIFYGKQSVNGFQTLRANLTRLDKDLQEGFLKKHEAYYSRLAGWLIDAGRLAEAQQVTAMLKEQELFELVRRDAASDPRTSQASLTGIEPAFARQFDALASQLASAGRGLDELERKARYEPLSAAEQTRRSEYERQLAAGRKAFERYLSELEAAFAKLDSERRKDIERLNVAEAEALQGSLDELGHGAVLVHYVVLDDALKIILTTPRLQRGYTVNVGRKPLNQAIQQLRKGIEGRRDVAQPARQLHDWLIAPLADDLQASGARTLMVALTDALRYLPFAALHDGQSWLAERYALALYTEAARQNIGKTPIAQWQLQAFGLTRKVEGFPALPGVGAELAAIVGPSGLPGRIRLDGEFTADSFKGAVDGRPPVLHVASHFVFRPGTEVDSFLLLGDGSRLSLADLKAYSFRQLDLLALSACETAMGGGQNERRSRPAAAVSRHAVRPLAMAPARSLGCLARVDRETHTLKRFPGHSRIETSVAPITRQILRQRPHLLV